MSFDTPQEHIDWAKTCIATAESSFAAYVQNNAFSNVTEFDPKTGEKIIKVKLANPVPQMVSGTVRGALLDIKHSFDQSLFAAARIAGCARFDKNYPWAETFFGTKGIIDKRQRKPESALPQFLVDEIFRQQPYGTRPGFSGGDNLIRDMARLVNDKHSIGFKVTASVTGMHIGKMTMSGGGSFFHGWDPVKEELIIAKLMPGGEISYQDCAMSADIFFKRAGDIGKVPVFAAAKIFADRAQFVLDGFKSACGH